MKPKNQCQECMYVDRPGDTYHPYLFCVLHKAGYNRDQIIKEIHAAAKATTPSKRP